MEQNSTLSLGQKEGGHSVMHLSEKQEANTASMLSEVTESRMTKQYESGKTGVFVHTTWLFTPLAFVRERFVLQRTV